MSSRWTAILSKRPLPGRVKKRLIPALGAEAAAGLQAAMLGDAVARCAGCAAFSTLLSPACEEPRDAVWFQGSFPEVRQRPQHGQGLAERLARLFGEVLDEGGEFGATSLVAIGSDQPRVSTGTILAAHERLEGGADLVLGPDAGGGYYLVGMRAPHPWVFTEIEMSTPSMCAETVRLAGKRGLAVERLPEGYDVDVVADLERLRAELAATTPREDPEFPERTWAFLQSLSNP